MSTPGLLALLSLYKRVLRVHRRVLPPPVRAFGDNFVKSEFQQHLRDGKVAQDKWQEFVFQWTSYVDQLEGNGGSIHGQMSEELLATLTPEQKSRLQELKKHATDFGKNTDS